MVGSRAQSYLSVPKIRELVPESQAYMDLLAFERKLDQTIMRKRLDIQEALKRPIKVTQQSRGTGVKGGNRNLHQAWDEKSKAQHSSPWHLNCIFPFRLQTRNYIRSIRVEQLAGKGAGELSMTLAPEIYPVDVVAVSTCCPGNLTLCGQTVLWVSS